MTKKDEGKAKLDKLKEAVPTLNFLKDIPFSDLLKKQQDTLMSAILAYIGVV